MGKEIKKTVYHNLGAIVDSETGEVYEPDS